LPTHLPASAPSLPSALQAAVSVLDSEALLQGGREVLIRHGDECYRLRHTRNDKLILTK
jgi:hemin uptake protein HemP